MGGGNPIHKDNQEGNPLHIAQSAGIIPAPIFLCVLPPVLVICNSQQVLREFGEVSPFAQAIWGHILLPTGQATGNTFRLK